MILALNTSTRQYSLALMERDGKLLSEHTATGKKGHFGSLMPALRNLVAESGKEIREIAAVIVATGPGSFTGLRIGMSAAKGLVQALNVPLVGISSLIALASQLPYTQLPITPLIESRRGEFFSASFLWESGGSLSRQKEDLFLKADDFPAIFREETVFVGSDFGMQAPLLRKMLGPRVKLAPPPCWGIKACFLAHLGLARLLAGEADDPHALAPRYLRPPDIRINPYPPA